jgi:hypothetical protein
MYSICRDVKQRPSVSTLQYSEVMVKRALGLSLLLFACSGDSPSGGQADAGPPATDGAPITNFGTYEAVFIWDAIDLDQATDLGFAATQVPAGDKVANGDIAFAEVGATAGLVDSSAGGNSHGVGVGFIDIDNDTFEDIVLATGNGTNSQVYKNDTNGGFTDFTAASGLGAILSGVDTYSVASADYDGDGDLDLYVTAHPNDFLLNNNGSGVFTDVTSAAGAGGPSSTQPGSASKIGSWGDYDGDGLIDLAVASSTFDSGASNGYLLRNLGDGSFQDVTAASGFHAAVTGNPCAVFWTDFDSDGDQDVWIWNDRGSSTENRVLLENNDGVFTDIAVAARIHEVNAGNPMGIDGADVDHDGHLDYYVSDIGGSPFLYNDGDSTFRDIQEVSGAKGEYGWGLGFEDFNADSWPDIFLAQEDARDYLSFKNEGTSPPSFTRQDWAHSDVGDGHNVAVAFADYDHNGTVDVVTAGTSGARMQLYRNDTNIGTNRWLEVRVPVTPTTGTKGGISGRVLVKTGGLVQFRDIAGGSSRASQNAMSVRFGLGQWTGAEWVAILWPDGRQVVVRNVEGNQVLNMPAQ